MFSRSSARRSSQLVLEPLENRLAPALPRDLIIALDPVLDRVGDQILTVQAYQDGSRMAYGIFDTGASAITFSADDQARFFAAGNPIPIKVENGAVGAGINGRFTGDVSEPAMVYADGMHAARLTFDEAGLPIFVPNFSDGAVVSGVQVLVGNPEGSATVPTLTGMPILNRSATQPQGRAALIEFDGVRYDFGEVVPGLAVNLPDLRFVSPGYKLPTRPGGLEPVSIPLGSLGTGGGGGRGVTEAPSPVQDNVKVFNGPVSIAGRRFLFDTGAQVTVLTPALAQLLEGPHSRTSVFSRGDWLDDGAGVPGDRPDNPFPSFFSGLTLPRTDGGTVTFTNVPFVVSELTAGLDGILGMNLFNSALAMLYDPHGSGTLDVIFSEQPLHGGGLDISILSGLGLPFADLLTSAAIPSFTLGSGRISGQVFLDYNDNGRPEAHEAGVAGHTLFLDENNNGRLDPGERTARTDTSGAYTFHFLVANTYTLRLLEAPGFVTLSGGTPLRVEVAPGTDNRGWNFAIVPRSPDEEAAFITGLYGTLLNRWPEPAGLQAWRQALAAGATREQIVQAIWTSDEHRGLQVDRYYAAFLHRAADPLGRAAWVHAFRAGLSETEVILGFLTSAEYLARTVSDATYVQALYVDVLGRSADAHGLTAWLQLLEQGLDRNQVAAAFVTSRESYRRVIDEYYASFLRRKSHERETDLWLDLLLDEQVSLTTAAVGFLASDEYWQRQGLRVGS